MLANTTAFGETDVLTVMRLYYFSKTSTFHGDFGTYVFAIGTSLLRAHFNTGWWPPKRLAIFSISDTFSNKYIIFANHAKTLFQASKSKCKLKQTKLSRRF